MRLFCLSPDQVDTAWDDIAHLIDSKSDLIPERLRENLKAARQQLWGLQDAERIFGVCVTEIIQTSQGLICLIVSAKGADIPKPLMERLADEIRNWARSLGCVALRIHGRRGWLRWDRRFKQTGIVAEAPL